MSQVSYIISNSGNINMIVDGESYTVAVDHANYNEIVERLNNEDYDGIVDLLDVSESISIASEGKVTVLDGCVTYNGRDVINPLTERILRFVKEGLPFKPMIRFLENLMDNPSRTSIQELYLFLEANTLPITEDGCFLAYKRVNKNFKSIRANRDGTHEDHSIGAKPEMPRNEVDDCRDNVCSSGFHFCSLSYLPHYRQADGHIVILKINPKDVVSIPSDYDNAKGRAWTYEVIGEHKGEDTEEAFDKPVYQADGGDWFDSDPDLCPDCGCHIDDCDCHLCQDCGLDLTDCICDPYSGTPNSSSDLGRKPNGHGYHNKRDASGRFTPRS